MTPTELEDAVPPPPTEPRAMSDGQKMGSSRDHAHAASDGQGALPLPSPVAELFEKWRAENLAASDQDIEAEMLDGYRDGFRGYGKPGGNRSPMYLHGWLNGAVDSGRQEITPEQQQFAADFIAWQRSASDGVGRAPRPPVNAGDKSRDDHDN